MGHLGLMPQSINKYGSYTVRAKEEAEAEKLIHDAKLLEEAGCFAIVIEKVPADLAERIAKELVIPIIGIGAGGGVDGQVLVLHDMLGLTQDFSPRFLRRYADLQGIMHEAIGNYVKDVNTPYYPIFTQENQEKYSKYLEYSQEFKNLLLVGRLAEYKYYDMDDIVKRALEVFEGNLK